MIEYKKLSQDSVVTLLNLVNEIFLDYVVPVNWTIQEFELDVRENSISENESFLVYQNGSPVGFCLVSLREKKARIDSFGVIKELRGTGLASEILFRCLESLKWKGIEKIVLEVAEGEKRAIRFYEKHGFKLKRKLESLKVTWPNPEENRLKFVQEDCRWVHDIAFTAKMNLKRNLNWQREPSTLLLSEDRYTIERILSGGFTVGYAVWGSNEHNGFILDAAPIADNTKFKEILTEVTERIALSKSNVIIVGVPEDDPLNKAAKSIGYEEFLSQWEMERRIRV